VLHVVVTIIEQRPTIDPGVSARYYISQCKIGTMGKGGSRRDCQLEGGRKIWSNEKWLPAEMIGNDVPPPVKKGATAER